MWHRLLPLSALLVASAVHAEALREGKDWRNCSRDDQCVVIEGLCDKTAVNALVKNTAIAYYKQEAPKVNCANPPFWRNGEKVARCRLGGCETIVKQGSAAAKK